jgi:hypothetical protein
MNTLNFLTIEVIAIAIFMIVLDLKFKNDDSSTAVVMCAIGVLYTATHAAYLYVN